MKFSELNEHQRTIFQDIVSNVVRSNIEQRNNLEIFSAKMLLIANGSGLLAMASFIGGIVSSHCPTDLPNLRWITAIYFVGLILAGCAHFYTVSLAIQRVPHANGKALDIVGDISNLEDAKDFNFDPKIYNRHTLCVLFAALSFILATLLAIIII